jgi:hypothetical protein
MKFQNPINTSEVEKANKALADAYTALVKAQNDYSTVKALNGQHGYSVTVNGVQVDVARMDERTYTAAVVRGREMIHLGALKALQSIIDVRRQRVADLEGALAKVAGGVE